MDAPWRPTAQGEVMTAATLVRVCDHTVYLDGRPMKVVVDLG